MVFGVRSIARASSAETLAPGIGAPAAQSTCIAV